MRPRLAYSVRDLLAIGSYHRRMAIGGMLIGLAAGLVALALTSTTYNASSLLIVLIGRESASPADVSGIGPGSLNVEGLKVLQSEISIVESVDVLERALVAVGPATVFPELGRAPLFGLLPPLPPEEILARGTELLRRRLSAADSQNSSNNGLFNGSNILRISVSLRDRDVAVKTLDALIKAYLDQRQKLYASPGGAFLRSELSKVDAQLKSIEQQLQSTRTKYGVLEINQDIALASTRLDTLLARENAVRERQQTVQSEIASANDQLRTLPERVFDSRDLTNAAPNDEARNTLLKLNLERAHMVQQYTASWPAVIELDRKIAAVQSILRGDAARPGNFTQRDIRNPSTDVLRNRLVAQQVELSAVATQLAELQRQYSTALARVNELREADSRLHDLERQRGVLENVQRQISLREANVRVQDTVNAARNANVNVVQPPTAPYTGSNMGLSYLVASVFAGLMAGIAAAIVAARLRNVFVVAREAERFLLLTALSDTSANESRLGTPAAKREITNLAAMLLDDAVAMPRIANRGITVLQVTGAEEMATHNIALALACEFAQTQGLRTLLIESPAQASAAGASDSTRKPGPTANLWTADAPSLLYGRSRELPAALVADIDIIVAATPGTGRDHAVRRLAAMADTTIMVVVAEQSQETKLLDLRDGVLASTGSVAGLVFTGRRSAMPGFMQGWV